MNGDGGTGGHADASGWPVTLRGVTESVVATRGPNDRWNFAALGLDATTVSPDTRSVARWSSTPIRATTWGRTRTWRNFTERGSGVVQFTSDPREFVDAALTIRESDDSVLPNAHGWVEVDVEQVSEGEDGGTRWVEWELRPSDVTIRSETVPTINRGFGAVIEATVAVSRLDVPAYDSEALLGRLCEYAETVDRCGGPGERTAFARIDSVSDWRDLLSTELPNRSPPRFE